MAKYVCLALIADFLGINMHDASSDIKAFLKSHLGPDFHLELLEFKTKTHDPYEKKTKNRFELRNSLYRFLKEEKQFIFEDALDLRNVPQKIGIGAKDFFSSLSHTDSTGVFAFDSQPIGVDFENLEKIKKTIVERVSNRNELKLHSNYQILWSIKEAAFKAIPFIIQPKTVSDIVIETVNTFSNEKMKKFEIVQFLASVKKSAKISIEGFGISNETTQLAVAKALVK